MAVILLFRITNELMLGMCDTISAINCGRVIKGMRNVDWPYIGAATVWVTAFSVSVLGLITNLFSAFRGNVATTKTYTELKALTGRENGILNQWLDLRTYDLKHLKKMWGEEDD